MTIFECKGCNFVTLLRPNYNRHLDTEKHKKNIPATKVAEKEPKKECYDIKCEYCNKIFSHTPSMYRHVKYRCKKTDTFSIIKQKNKQLELEKRKNEKLIKKHIELQQKHIETQKLISTTINNTTNIHIQNITILAYKDTDTSHLTEKDYVFCIKQPNGVKHLIEKIHFNPMKPENQNLTITNLTDKYMMIYDGRQWKKVLKDELNKIYNQKESLLEEWVEQDPTLKEKFYQYIKNERKDVHLHRMEDIKLMMYNQKPVAIV